ncbi:MAG TPA: aminoglycoside phosphotransferase family protein [Candidatus Dormibacteraeota bacterium]|jgi:hygromycin-B 4-O-kinase|nr:aminoglycoside phosphotransferase family protein [Candidatus Dormibacteraeota bacterium]
MPERLDVAPSWAAAFLESRYGAGVGELGPINHGEWSRTYSFVLKGRRRIVRFSVLDEDFLKDRGAAELVAGALPVPPVLEFGEAFGGFFAVTDFLPGTPLDDLDAAGMTRALPSLLTTLDTLRGIDLGAETGYGGWIPGRGGFQRSWREYLLQAGEDSPGGRTHGWRERLHASATGDGPYLRARQRLFELAPSCPEIRHLIHNDLLNYNVLVEDGRVSALLDWGCSLYGDFLYDLGLLSFASAWVKTMRHIDVREEARRHFREIGLEVPGFDERLTCYEIHVGLDAQAYQAFTSRWEELAFCAERTLRLAGLS